MSTLNKLVLDLLSLPRLSWFLDFLQGGGTAKFATGLTNKWHGEKANYFMSMTSEIFRPYI